MKIFRFLLFLAFAGLMLPANAQQKHPSKAPQKKTGAPITKNKKAPSKGGVTKTLASGLKYRMIKDVPGTPGKYNDIIEINVINRTGKDSLLFNTFEAPEPLTIAITPPKFHGDFMEILTYASAGDSVEVWSPLDSLKKMMQVDPKLLAQGPYLHYVIKIYRVETQDQYKTRVRNEAQAQLAADTLSIKNYLKESGINAKRTEDGLYYVITQPGSGPLAKGGDSVSVHYTGMLLNGKIFDSSIPRKEPIKFVLGMGMVIPGWDEGISLLNKGAKAMLFIPSSLAYGKRGAGAEIPANAVLIFNVELVDIKSK